MTRYRYRALDAEGRHVENEIEADSPYELTRALKSQGITVTAVTPADSSRPSRFGFRQLRWDDLRLFVQQMASIVRGGYPLAPALKAMARDLHRPRLRAVLEELHVDVDRGIALEEAVRRQGNRFPQTYAALVRAGEITGNLGGVLGLMGDHASRMSAGSHRLKLAMMYPFILALSSTFVLGYLLLNTIPVFAEVFDELGGQLPAPTRLLLFLSEVLRGYWPVLSVVLPLMALGAAGILTGLRQSPDGRYLTDWLKLFTPSLGPWYHGAVQARFFRTLALLLAARVPIIESLTLAGAASGCAVLERGCARACGRVAAGERLTDALRDTRFFGPNAIWLLGTGEERGCAEEALAQLAENFDRETRARELSMGTFTAPMVTAFFGLIIGFVVMAMYLPIFTLGDQITGGG